MQRRYLFEKHSSTKMENGDITKWIEWEASSLKVRMIVIIITCYSADLWLVWDGLLHHPIL